MLLQCPSKGTRSSIHNTPLRDLASCAHSFISNRFERNSASRCRQLLVALMLLPCSVMLLPSSFKMCPHSFACSLVFLRDFWSGTPSTNALSFTGLFLHQSCRSTKPRILIHGQRLLLGLAHSITRHKIAYLSFQITGGAILETLYIITKVYLSSFDQPIMFRRTFLKIR